MIIAISGMPGAGKSTASKMLSRRLGMKRYYMGEIRRELARKHGMTIQQLNEIGERYEWTDKEVDDFQRQLGESRDNFIIEGRTSFFLLPDSLKVFLDVDFDVGSRRIYEEMKGSKNDERNEGVYKTLSDAKKAVKKRIESDRRRYMKYYNVDIYDRSNYDLVINTTKMKPATVVKKIAAAAKRRN